MKSALASLPKMIRKGAPHLIRNDEELAEYTAELFKLTGKAKTTREEDQAIDLLTLLIEHYETERYPVPKADPVTVLRFLMESHSLSQKDLSRELGVESTVSLVLRKKRKLNVKHIAKLSRRFQVSPAVFFAN
ncbi:MAG TPA: helix-turn-helix domain-containing protein [Acidobacteriaceae bacterium]|nr:helix-turn-helix domain-containing protein [Acidobacteriaceae bacterium]